MKKYEQYELIALLRASKEILMHADGNIPFVFRITDKHVACTKLARCIDILIEAYDIADTIYINMDLSKEDNLKDRIIQAYYDIVKKDKSIGRNEIGAMIRVAREMIIKIKVYSPDAFNIGKTHEFVRTISKSLNSLQDPYVYLTWTGNNDTEDELKKSMMIAMDNMLNKESEAGD